MDENKLKAIVKEAVKPIIDQLNDPDTGLKRLNERVDANTTAVMELEKTVKGYADSYKINDANIRKMEERLETIEEKEGIQVPPEFLLAPLADI